MGIIATPLLPSFVLHDKNHFLAGLNPRCLEQPPTLAVMVLSPDDRFSPVMRRIIRLLKCGVVIVWLADPEERTITVFRSDRGMELLESHQEIMADDALPGFRCRVADFFYMPGEASAATQG